MKGQTLDLLKTMYDPQDKVVIRKAKPPIEIGKQAKLPIPTTRRILRELKAQGLVKVRHSQPKYYVDSKTQKKLAEIGIQLPN
jgi:DNA-binding MarR family transcriptional regulator